MNNNNKVGRRASHVFAFTEDNKCKFCSKVLSQNTTLMKKHFINKCLLCPDWVRTKLITETKQYSHRKTSNTPSIRTTEDMPSAIDVSNDSFHCSEYSSSVNRYLMSNAILIHNCTTFVDIQYICDK